MDEPRVDLLLLFEDLRGEELPLLSALVERRAGGQRYLSMGRGAGISEQAGTLRAQHPVRGAGG